MFIVLEGGEGAGKTTQAVALAAYLEATHDLPVVLAREPGGTAVGEAIREVVLSNTIRDRCGGTIPAKTEALLFIAARAALVEQVIAPALADGKTVVCDRFIDSTGAYQGAGRGLGKLWLNTMSRWAVDKTIPDLTIVLDVEPQVGLGRVRARGETNRLDDEELAFHERVRKGFLDIARLNQRVADPRYRRSRYVVIDAGQASGMVGKQVRVAAECMLVDTGKAAPA